MAACRAGTAVQIPEPLRKGKSLESGLAGVLVALPGNGNVGSGNQRLGGSHEESLFGSGSRWRSRHALSCKWTRPLRPIRLSAGNMRRQRSTRCAAACPIPAAQPACTVHAGRRIFPFTIDGAAAPPMRPPAASETREPIICAHAGDVSSLDSPVSARDANTSSSSVSARFSTALRVESIGASLTF